MITVSALNILETFLLDAPIARRIPISFVLSCTDIRVITPIIIEETISDTATNAISTYVIALIMVVTDDIMIPTRSVYLISLISSTVSLYAVMLSAITSLFSNDDANRFIEEGLSLSTRHKLLRTES